MPEADCLTCNTSFYVKLSHEKLGWGKYCSKSCQTQSQFNGKHFNCSICNKKIYRTKAQIKHSKSKEFFCSKSCQTLWRNKYFIAEKHPSWNNGTNSYRKRLLKSKKTPICKCCGIIDIRLLVAHHIDHNRTNNKLSNLEWLCLNCHHLIHVDENLENDFLKKL
jgi:hypothetical protein